ncbi:uncharacterized protein LOC110896790 isoform X2 [Helianthus annuus]|uniref:uncharacterized protein LOC110896790 isoform X2 n=1 Tax=Helianthus annuus TaxID=4232 RepID=UPI000B8F694A|nr:uncharacterized protein LOC110896790 isoform X2 [Helianthus annuus]
MKMKLKHYVHLSNERLEEKPSAELFHGFQTIKGVERDQYIAGLATPEFAATYVENMMKYASRTEYVLKLANKKLERVLNSDHKACTLQEPPKLKHNRITLSELFQKTKMAEEITETKRNHLMKKILKRGRSTTDSVRSNDSALPDEKLHKILRMVHLEALASSQNMRMYVKKSNEEVEGYRNRHKLLAEDNIIFPYRSISANHTKSKVSHPTYAVGTTRKRERWIKSDEEYLILEL